MKRILKLVLLSAVFTIACSKAQTDSIKIANIGVRAYQRGNFDRAMHMFKSAIHLFPKNAIAHYQLGLILLYHKQQPAAAATEFENAIEYDPRLTAAMFQLGRASFDLGKMDTARKYLSLAIEKKPKIPGPYYWLGRIEQKEEKLEAADNYYRKAIEQDPFYSRAFVALADIYQEASAYPEAIQVLKEDLRINPKDAEGHEKLGLLYLNLAQYKQAASELRDSLANNPDSIMDYLNLASALVGQQKYREAAFYVKRFVLEAKGNLTVYIAPAKVMYDKIEELVNR